MVAAALLGYLGLVSGLLLNEISALVVIGNALRLLTTKNRFDSTYKKVMGLNRAPFFCNLVYFPVFLFVGSN